LVLMRRGFTGAVLLTIIFFGCDAAGTRAAPSPSVSPSTAAVPSREPAALPRYPEERAVLDVLTASGMRVELVGGSKAEMLLGTPRRARVFIGTLAGSRVGADVLFLDAPAGDVRAWTLAGSAAGFSKVGMTVGRGAGFAG